MSLNETDVIECGTDAPPFHEFTSNLTLLDFILLSFGTLLTVLTVAIFIFEIWHKFKTDKNHYHRGIVLNLLSIYPVYSVTSLISAWAPLTSPITDLLCTLYLSMVFAKYWKLARYYFGGEEQMITCLEGTPVQLNTGPCCCCCLCLPKNPMNKLKLRNLRITLKQFPIVSVSLVYISAIIERDIPQNDYLKFILIFRAISALSALYACHIYVGLVAQYLTGHRLRLKFLVIKLTLVTTNIQLLVLVILSLCGAVPCNEEFSSDKRARWIQSIVLIPEMFIISILASKCHWKENAKLMEVQHPTDTSFVMNDVTGSIKQINSNGEK